MALNEPVIFNDSHLLQKVLDSLIEIGKIGLGLSVFEVKNCSQLQIGAEWCIDVVFYEGLLDVG